ncbi:hypothetical protein BCR44DRAFT_1213835 [Catenaria anguillulae PL171]|uniref:Uncharacterized protein n=1 Tax=Catenaria anguillulae PL171 TaxID=765915 RepID=A0A1Y2HYK0_9FUNG|nr:hypothetical protein BCR44DRAFT_1213835 [Catenaria anguillulae PL171]
MKIYKRSGQTSKQSRHRCRTTQHASLVHILNGHVDFLERMVRPRILLLHVGYRLDELLRLHQRRHIRMNHRLDRQKKRDLRLGILMLLGFMVVHQRRRVQGCFRERVVNVLCLALRRRVGVLGCGGRGESRGHGLVGTVLDKGRVQRNARRGRGCVSGGGLGRHRLDFGNGFRLSRLLVLLAIQGRQASAPLLDRQRSPRSP